MLVLTVAMPTNFIKIFFLLPFIGVFFQGQQFPGVVITQPAQGDAVRGVVQVTGSAAGEGFASYDLVYSFENSAAPNWFAIASANQPVNSGNLGSWDTTIITDGDYSIKLVVHRADGSQQETVLQHILVRNYTPPAGAAEAQSPGSTENAAGQTGAVTDGPSQAANPASLSPDELKQTVFLGLGLGVAALLLTGIYVLGRRISRR